MRKTTADAQTRIGLDMPSSRREIEEDLLEDLCRLSQKKELLTIPDLSTELNISEKELIYYIRQMKRHGYVEISPEETQIYLTELGRITGAECSYRHEPGDYTFLMGIYYMEKTYPRRFSREFQNFSENIHLHVEEGKSWFELEPKEGNPGSLWYQDRQKWICAKEHEGRPVLPTDIFEFTIQRRDPIIEGTALIAFARDGERPADWNSQELDVHIW